MNLPITSHQIRLVAVLSFRDERTVKKAYRGEPVQALAHASIADAAERAGVLPPPALVAASSHAA